MASSLSTAITLSSESKSNYTRVYPREYERNHYYRTNRDRSDKPKSVWRRIQKLDWYKRRIEWRWRYYWNKYHIFYQNTRGRLSVRNNNKTGRYRNWFSFTRNNRYRKRYRDHCYYYFLISILAIGSPIRAEDTYNTSAPSSTATGNVTNSAIQFQNNGAPTRQNYGGGIVCNGPTMTLSPFWLGNRTNPQDLEKFSQGSNFGAQVNFMVPLDYETVEQCKSMARRKEEKMRVDYELVRALKCAELQQKGFTIRPGSRVEHLCNDIVPIVSLIKQTEQTNEH